MAEDEIGAVVQARATGRRVEVLSLRSMTSRTWVEPDGLWSTEVAAGPVRFVDVAGRWRDIDLDLVTAADGSVAPVAHPLGLVLPGGDSVGAPPEKVGELVGGDAAAGGVRRLVPRLRRRTGCSTHSQFAEALYRSSPASVEAQDAEFEKYRPAVLQCLSEQGLDLEGDESRGEIEAFAYQGMSTGGDDCLIGSGYQP